MVVVVLLLLGVVVLVLQQLVVVVLVLQQLVVVAAYRRCPTQPPTTCPYTTPSHYTRVAARRCPCPVLLPSVAVALVAGMAAPPAAL